MSILIPAYKDTGPLHLPESPFHRLTTLSQSELAHTRSIDAADRRLLTEHFVDTFQWESMCQILPLQLELPPDVRHWGPRMCRSHYQWLPPDDIHSADDLIGLDNADGYIRMTWCCGSLTFPPGGPSSDNVSAAHSDLLLSTLSASA